MRIVDGVLLLSATDLTKFSRCEHLAHLDYSNALGTLEPLAPPLRSPASEVIARRGSEHEKAYVDSLIASGKTLVTIERPRAALAQLRDAHERTTAAMRSGVDYVYQATFFDGRWIGIADLLKRVERPSLLGEHSYEVADVKLSRSVKPHFLLQLACYSEQLSSILGAIPEQMHVVLGTGEVQSFRCDDYAAYFRHVRSRFEDFAVAGAASTYPLPVELCSMCEWNLNCWRHLLKDDHLSLVANIRRGQISRFTRSDIPTLTILGRNAPGRVAKMAPSTVASLHQQARLQLEFRESGKHRYELLPPEAKHGFERLPLRADGDLYFDVEADPFVGSGLTYLFGIAVREGGQTQYHRWWAHDDAEERVKFEQVIDFIVERLAACPALHVYHYGAQDAASLRRLMNKHDSRDAEVDDLLRRGVFVDIYPIVRQTVRISQPGYSLKKVEAFYYEREATWVRDTGGAIVAYETWLEARQDEILLEIERYNRDDCVSLAELHAWLLDLRNEAEQQYGITFEWKGPEEQQEQKPETREAEIEAAQLSESLLEGLPKDLGEANAEEKARWMMAQLVHYHRREARPAWWWFYERRDKSPEELVDDSESIGRLDLNASVPPEVDKKSLVYTYSFPPQEYKLAPGDTVIDPLTRKSAGTLTLIEESTGTLRLKRGPSFRDIDHPRALIPKKIIGDAEVRTDVRRLASTLVGQRPDASPFRAAVDILFRCAPRVQGVLAGNDLQHDAFDIREVKEILHCLDDSYLFIQGPPGSGKTYNGARLIVDLLRNGKRVGVSATAHKAIHNLLHEVERVASGEHYHFSGLKRFSDVENQFNSALGEHALIANASKIDDFTDAAHNLIAGTKWLFADPSIKVDYLFIDEAGQVALADALAMATASRNVVLLGDPLQLAQVSQGVHPTDGGLSAGASVLEHLLGDAKTIPRDRGFFLEKTWRMHPNVSGFISSVVYDGRLESAPGREVQHVESAGLRGSGLRFLPVEHEGNSTSSEEEAETVAREVHLLLQGGSFTNIAGKSDSMTPNDILVVAPYNAQVRCVKDTLTREGISGVRVGTVDKFQGLEAPVVFFTMATSSGDDLPRDIDFLFSQNRLNVAVSRAQCLAIVIASLRLLDVSCRTTGQMRLVNALCRFVEMARMTS
jgi:uncharacterized protein